LSKAGRDNAVPTRSETPDVAVEQASGRQAESASSSGSHSTSANDGAPAFPKTRVASPPDQDCNAATVAAYAAWTKLPEDFLRSLDLADIQHQHRPALRIPYRDRTGAEIAVRIQRFLTTKGVHHQRFAWRRGDRPQLYGLERLDRPEFVVLVESEAECHTLWYHDVPALGIPGPGAWREERDAPHLEGISRIYLVVEPGQDCDLVKHWLARSQIRERAHVVDLTPFKGLGALHCADPDGFKASFATALENARSLSRIAAEAKAEATAEAWATCQALATRPRILDEFADAYRSAGAVGEARSAMILYLALTSRTARTVSRTRHWPSTRAQPHAESRRRSSSAIFGTWRIARDDRRACASGTRFPTRCRSCRMRRRCNVAVFFGR